MKTEEIRTRIEEVAKEASNPESAKGFLELGYSFASSEIAELLIEIEALKKEVERIKGIFEDQYKLDAGIYFTRYFKYSSGNQIEAMVNASWEEVVKNNKL
jgi:hypothetical protein